MAEENNLFGQESDRGMLYAKAKATFKGGGGRHYVQNTKDKLNSPVTMNYYFSTHALVATEDAFCRAGQVCCVV